MILSLIIPVYNVEQYIAKCLDSCLSLKLKNYEYEIIIVIDGSQDGSSAIIEKYAEKKENINVIYQENKGLSEARNVGLRKAKGDFVWFVDSDDWIIADVLETILENKPLTNVIALTTVIFKGKERQIVDRGLKAGTYDVKEVYYKTYKYPYSGVQFYIFERKFLNNNSLFFKPNVYFEDILFITKVFSLSERIYVCDIPSYVYRIREHSITTTKVSLKKSIDLLLISDDLWNFSKNIKLHQDIVFDSIQKIYTVLFRYYYLKLNRDDKINLKKDIKKRDFFKKLLVKKKDIKYLVYYIMFRVL